MEHTELCIIAFTGLRQLTLPTARWIHSTSSQHPVSCTFIVLSPFHLRLSLPSGLFQIFQLIYSTYFYSLPCVLHVLPRFNLVTLITFSAEWKLIRYSLGNFLYYPDTVTPRSEYPPEHAVLRRLPSTLCQYIVKCACTWVGTFHRKQFTSLREGSHVKHTPPVQTTRTWKQSQMRFLTWSPRTPRGLMCNFSRSVNLGGGGLQLYLH